MNDDKILEKDPGLKPVSETVITTKVDVFEKKLPDGTVQKESVVTTITQKHAVPHAGHLWTVVYSLVVIACVAGIIFFTTQPPRAIVIHGGGLPHNGVTSTVVQGNFVTTTALLDTALYNRKLLELANLPVIRVKTIVPLPTSTMASSTVTSTIVFSTTTAPSAWPVKTAYPNAGALLPFDRIVAYYGNFYSTQMGVLGEYPEDQMLAMLASTTAAWQVADPTTPTIPALDYIAVTAQASPSWDGKYRLRMPPSQIQKRSISPRR